MASQDINLADSWVCWLVSQKIDEIASDEAHGVYYDEEADYGEEAAAASSHAAQAPPRKKIRIRTRDIPTNLVLRREDVNTVDIMPANRYRLLIAQLLGIRRKVIEEHLDTSSFAAETVYVYVAHQYQAPIRHAMEEFWKHHIASTERTGWRNYLRAVRPGARRSYWTWCRQCFGNERICDLFVAFGWIDGEMIGALNGVANELDPASTRDTRCDVEWSVMIDVSDRVAVANST